MFFSELRRFIRKILFPFLNLNIYLKTKELEPFKNHLNKTMELIDAYEKAYDSFIQAENAVIESVEYFDEILLHHQVDELADKTAGNFPSGENSILQK